MVVKSILCPIDFSAIADEVVNLAVRACTLFGSRLVVQYNIEVVVPSDIPLEVLPLPDFLDEAYAKQRINEYTSMVPESIPLETRITRGLTDSSILNLASELPADLIVMGTHGRGGLKHMLIGSTTERVLASSSCPVLAVRHGGRQALFPETGAESPPPNAHVVVPIDFSSHSLYTLEYAFGLATDRPVTLHLLHVVQPVSWEDMQGAGHFNVPEYQRARIREAKELLRVLTPEDLSDRVHFHVRMGPVVTEIVELADSIQASLIIMGVTPGGLIADLLFGPVAYGVLRASTCPVWVVPGTRRRVEKDHKERAEFSDFPHPCKP